MVAFGSGTKETEGAAPAPGSAAPDAAPAPADGASGGAVASFGAGEVVVEGSAIFEVRQDRPPFPFLSTCSFDSAVVIPI